MLSGLLFLLAFAISSPLAPHHRQKRHLHGSARCNRGHSGLPCPEGLRCARANATQFPQKTGYAGHPLACLGTLPPPTLDGELNTLINLFAATTPSLLPLETPIQLRATYYADQALWNTLTRYDTLASPHSYAAGFGLPFAAKDTSASIRDKNVAISYSMLRICLAIIPGGCPGVAALMAGPLGLDPTYLPNTNFNLADPRDVGTAAALATVEYAKTDQWNALGMPGFPMPFQDPTESGAAFNSPTLLRDITAWQPLLETSGNGYYNHQTHVGAVLARQLVSPFSRAPDFYTRFRLANPKIYPDQDKFTDVDLAQYRAQAQQVIDAGATLTDRQKMLLVAYDVKLFGFGFVPIGQYSAQGQWNLQKTVEYALALGGSVYDALLASFTEKMRVNAVRPKTAIQYMFHNETITTYAGPFLGTRTFPGREFNSYLRTMPHSDTPSGTACICVAFAELTERFLGQIGNLQYGLNFPQGCSLVEPGAVPAADLQLLYTNTAEFVRDCAQSRVWAGVHFQKSVDTAVEMCSGIGQEVYNRIVQLRGYN